MASLKTAYTSKAVKYVLGYRKPVKGGCFGNQNGSFSIFLGYALGGNLIVFVNPTLFNLYICCSVYL